MSSEIWILNLTRDADRSKSKKNHKSKTYPKITMTADGVFDTRKIFSMCRELDITPNIREFKQTQIPKLVALTALDPMYYSSSSLGAQMPHQ